MPRGIAARETDCVYNICVYMSVCVQSLLLYLLSDIQIGFQNASYTFQEPQFETEIDSVVFLEKQGGRISEQCYVVIVDLNKVTPNANIQPATLSTVDADNDYIVSTPGAYVAVLEFSPDAQHLDFPFILFPDDVAEGTEAFRASLQPSENLLHPAFTDPSAGVLYSSTYIHIIDDDCE